MAYGSKFHDEFVIHWYVHQLHPKPINHQNNLLPLGLKSHLQLASLFQLEAFGKQDVTALCAQYAPDYKGVERQVAGAKLVDKVQRDVAAVYADPAFRNQFREDLKNPLAFGNWGRIGVYATKNPALKSLEGKPIAQIAQEQGKDGVDAFLDLVLADNLECELTMASWNTREDRMRELLNNKSILMALGDGGAHVDMLCDAGYPTYLLGTWVREKEVLSLEEGVRRTVQAFEAAGVAAIHIEDQTSPKRCAQFPGSRTVEDFDVAVAKIAAAVAAQSDPDFLVIARTDSAGSMGLDEAIRRAQAFASVGAAAVFVELKAHDGILDDLRRVADNVPIACMVNIDAGGPLAELHTSKLSQHGIVLAIYPALIRNSVGFAMREALQHLQADGRTAAMQPRMISGAQYNAALGLSEVEQWEARFM